MTAPEAFQSQDKHEEFACFSGAKASEVAKTSGDDFIWSLTEEPHFSRRMEILKKYPQIQKLFGVDAMLKWNILGLVLLQLICAYAMRDGNSWRSPLFWVVAYVVGGTCNQALFLGIHELSHNLGFKSIQMNKLFGILVANVPIGFPYAASFKPYHMLHHKYQGVEGVDTDLPTKYEGVLFSSTVGKLFFATFQVLFYAIRPVMVKQLPLTKLHLLNVAWIAAVDVALYYAFGWGPLVYLWISTLIAGSGLHPCASHFIAEHYVFSGEWETYSYYGWLNYFCFNVGYHNEHHDFPNIPGSRLPQLRAIASEYYDKLPYHHSWPLVTWKFVTEPSVTVYNRVKRHAKAATNMKVE